MSVRPRSPEEAAAACLPGWNIRCNVCGRFGARWKPDLRPGWGCLAVCDEDGAKIDEEVARHERAMRELTRVSFEQLPEERPERGEEG